jgi:UDP-N-acetylglucosamine--N-acetylmuramyl-(pentapeptide) pyrophosphoryl-undecaprenol N-acetylglucosamine transferase
VARLGNPVRRRFVEAAAAARGAAPGAEPRLLVLGGSQGSRAVNDLVLGAVEILASRGQVPLIVHQAGPADAIRCGDRYRSLGLAERATVRPFIEDMPGALGEAALVVGRAGALTLAELAIVGRPAVLVPLPTAADDHQSKNAEVFARAGAAVVLAQHRTTPAHLADVLVELLADAPRRQAMAHAMAALARPSAARDVVDRLEELRAG